MSIKTELFTSFKKGDAVTKLIYINLAVFLLLKLAHIVSKLLLINDVNLLTYLAVPANISLLLYRPWTILSHMFLHEGFIHILFNVLNLYWFGRFFLMFFNQKQLVGLYILGGIVGALTYVVAFNTFPYFQQALSSSLLLGASASVLAIVMATTMYQPNMEIQLILIGKIKLKYIAVVVFFISLFSVAGDNAGGNLAHLGGILMGYLFALSIKKGKDLTAMINKLIDFFVDLFARKPKMKITYDKRTVSDAEWNEKKKKENSQIDLILDKIKKSGYESLTAEEKKKLFDQGN